MRGVTLEVVFGRIFMVYSSSNVSRFTIRKRFLFKKHKKTTDAYGEIYFTKTKIVGFMHFRLNRGLQNR